MMWLHVFSRREWLSNVTALPPDVRRGLAAPSDQIKALGYALRFERAKPEPRAQPNIKQSNAARRSHASHPAAKPQNSRRYTLNAKLAATLLLVAFTLSGAQTQSDPARTLTTAETVDREIRAGETHRYKINLKADEFLNVVLDQHGIDAQLTLVGPDGQKLVEADSPNGAEGPEPLFWIAGTTGDYQLEVRPRKKGASAGRYELKLREVRSVTEVDRKRVAAQQAFLEAARIRSPQTAEARQKQLQKYNEALRLWQQAREGEREGLTLTSLGYIYSELDQYQKALESYLQALPIWKTLGHRVGQAAVLQATGNTYFLLKEYQKAVQTYNEALPILKELGDQRGEAAVFSLMGLSYESLGEKQKALDVYTQQLEIVRAIGYRAGEGAALIEMGGVYSSLGDKQKALDLYQQALAILKAANDRYGEATALWKIGRISSDQGDKEKALDYYGQALPIFKDLKQHRDEAELLSAIGGIHSSLGEKQKALEFYNQSVQLFHEAEDARGEATALHNIASVYSGIGEKQKALDYFEQALRIRRAVSDRAGEAATLNGIGSVYSSTGEPQKALDYYNQSLSIRRAIGDRSGEAVSLNNIGLVYSNVGEKQKALEYYNQALPIRRAIKDRGGEGVTLNNIGLVYQSLGQPRKALDYHNQSLLIRREVHDRLGEGVSLNNIGLDYQQLGELQKALDYFNQALLIRRAISDRAGEAASLLGVGGVYEDLRERRKALDYYTQALPIWRAIGDRRGEATTLNDLGLVYKLLGDNGKALDYFNQSLPIKRAIGDATGEAVTLSNLMYLWKATDPSVAILYGKQSINVTQQLRSNIEGLDKDLKASFLKLAEHRYRVLAQLLISQGRLPEAQAVLDLLKEEEFSQLVRRGSESGETLPYTAAESDAIKLVEELATIGRRRSDLLAKQSNQTLQPAEIEQLNRLEEQINTANKELRRTLVGLARAEASARSRIEEVTKEQSLMRDLRELGTGTVALYTVLAADAAEQDAQNQTGSLNPKTGWIILVTPDFRKAYPIDVNNLEKTVFSLREALRSDKYDPRPLAQKLYRMLFLQTSAQQKTTLAADLDAYLGSADQKTLMWSLDGVLRYVPIAALHDGQQYLIERYRNVVFNTASLGSLKDKSNKPWTALGLGVSEARVEEGKTFSALTGAEHELYAIVRQKTSKPEVGILPGTIRLNKDFNKQSMIDGLRTGPSVVHIASHFSFNVANPEQSFLLLGTNHLSVGELQDMSNPFERVELLTLSACDTAMGSANGKEVEGFAYTAQSLGAKSVIASLWPVSDEATDALMTNFYRLRRDDLQLPKGEALRQAQLGLLRGSVKGTGKQTARPDRADLVGTEHLDNNLPRFSYDVAKPFAHPYYWAPFILIGNWR
jgi:CHAT domain-containing protein/Tfp pilus assembly protein PilF